MQRTNPFSLYSSDAPPANWPMANFRWYALDGAGGNDDKLGYSDVSSADAGTVARKTIAGLAAILPRVGANRKIAIIIEAGTYADSIDTLLQGFGGYSSNSFLVGTVTNATAGSVAFAGDAGDRISAGFVAVTGLSTTGYNPTGSPSTTTMTLQLNGGGSPALPAEPAAPLGWRIRFDSATTTAALRNICRPIVGVPTSASLTYQTLPAVPATSDVFYIEQAGVVMSAGRTVFLSIGATAPASASGFQGGFQIAGVDLTDTLRLGSGRVRWAGCRWAGAAVSVIRADDHDYGPSYVDETGTTRIIGAGLRVENTMQWNDFSNVNPLGQQCAVFVSQLSLFRGTLANIGASSYFGSGILIDEVAQPTQANGTHAPFYAVGNTASSAFPSAFRVKGAIAANAGARSGVQVCVASVALTPMTIDAVGAFPAIQLIGRCVVSINSGITGSVGNADVGLDLTLAKGSLIILPNGAPTVTGAGGDVRLAGGQIVTWTQLAATSLIDSNGNRIISAGQPILSKIKFSGAIVTSAASATSSYLADTGAQLIVANLPAQRYPTSLMLALRLRVTKLIGAGVLTNNVTCTLYKNGVATAMLVTILADDAQFTTYVDDAHPILFADGDTLDLRLDDASADILAGVLPVSSCLECAA